MNNVYRNELAIDTFQIMGIKVTALNLSKIVIIGSEQHRRDSTDDVDRNFHRTKQKMK